MMMELYGQGQGKPSTWKPGGNVQMPGARLDVENTARVERAERGGGWCIDDVYDFAKHASRCFNYLKVKLQL